MSSEFHGRQLVPRGLLSLYRHTYKAARQPQYLQLKKWRNTEIQTQYEMQIYAGLCIGTRAGHAYVEYANDADYAHMRNMRMRMRIENLIHIIHI